MANNNDLPRPWNKKGKPVKKSTWKCSNCAHTVIRAYRPRRCKNCLEQGTYEKED